MSQPFEPRAGRGWKPIQTWGCLTFLIGVVLAILLPNFQQHGDRGPLTACKSNCKNLATALEMYSSDNQGQYPTHLAKLTEGNYLKVVPTCPAAGRITYTDYQYHQKPDRFTFSCVGNNHADAYSGFSTSSNNFPQYRSDFGLQDHP